MSTDVVGTPSAKPLTDDTLLEGLRLGPPLGGAAGEARPRRASPRASDPTLRPSRQDRDHRHLGLPWRCLLLLPNGHLQAHVRAPLAMAQGDSPPAAYVITPRRDSSPSRFGLWTCGGSARGIRSIPWRPPRPEQRSQQHGRRRPRTNNLSEQNNRRRSIPWAKTNRDDGTYVR